MQMFGMNIGLALLNLIPVPPLDGSKILASLMPGGFFGNLQAIEAFGAQWGFLILYGLMLSGALGAVFSFVYPIANSILWIGY
jgi:Zn-dependent protease